MPKDPTGVKNSFAEYNRAGNTLVQKTVFNYPFGSTMVMSFPDDADWRLAAASSFNNLLVPEDEFLNGSSRVIGWGVEVHDVTAELYKQGTLTVFSVPQAAVVPETFNITDVASADVVHSAFSGHVYKRWPNSLSEAVLYPDSRQWNAADGVYTVIPCMGPDNPAAQPSYTQPMMPLNATLADQIGGTNDGLNLFVPPSSVTAEGSGYWNPAKLVPFHSRGVALTGLNAYSTFTVNVKYYIETFPALDDKTIMTLASPSAPHDPVALEMISRAVQTLPTGVPVGDNPGGEWFMSVLGEVLPMLGTGLAALTGIAPLGLAGAGLGKLASNQADKWKAEAAAERKAADNAVRTAVRATMQAKGNPGPSPKKLQQRKQNQKASAKKRAAARNAALKNFLG